MGQGPVHLSGDHTSDRQPRYEQGAEHGLVLNMNDSELAEWQPQLDSPHRCSKNARTSALSTFLSMFATYTVREHRSTCHGSFGVEGESQAHHSSCGMPHNMHGTQHALCKAGKRVTLLLCWRLYIGTHVTLLQSASPSNGMCHNPPHRVSEA